MRFGQRLEHERGEGPVVLGVQPNGLITLGAGERVNLLHVVGVRHELHEFREQRTHADHAVGGGARCVNKLMTPRKLAPAPIGISTGTTVVVRRSSICA